MLPAATAQSLHQYPPPPSAPPIPRLAAPLAERVPPPPSLANTSSPKPHPLSAQPSTALEPAAPPAPAQFALSTPTATHTTAPSRSRPEKRPPPPPAPQV